MQGYGEPIKTQGVTMYKGEYEVLFIRDDTYVCINDDFCWMMTDVCICTMVQVMSSL